VNFGGLPLGEKTEVLARGSARKSAACNPESFSKCRFILLSEPGWRLLRARFARPAYPPTGDPPLYKVTVEHWVGFEVQGRVARSCRHIRELIVDKGSLELSA